ncbi:MAG: class I SAM-dependent methyltransferase [Patescibacteria group bacterium]
MNAKRQLGQFFTTNSDYILSGFSKLVKDKKVSDPFAGSGELIDWAIENRAKSATGFDVDDSYINNKTIFKNDSINNPKKYDFVLTNPPYLHKNKADKNIKENYE